MEGFRNSRENLRSSSLSEKQGKLSSENGSSLLFYSNVQVQVQHSLEYVACSLAGTIVTTHFNQHTRVSKE
jgi:hypothetical protein